MCEAVRNTDSGPRQDVFSQDDDIHTNKNNKQRPQRQRKSVDCVAANAARATVAMACGKLCRIVCNMHRTPACKMWLHRKSLGESTVWQRITVIEWLASSEPVSGATQMHLENLLLLLALIIMFCVSLDADAGRVSLKAATTTAAAAIITKRLSVSATFSCTQPSSHGDSASLLPCILHRHGGALCAL